MSAVSVVKAAISALAHVGARDTGSSSSSSSEGSEPPVAMIHEAMSALMEQPLPEATVAAFLTALQLRYPLPPPALLRACADAMLAKALPLPLPDEEDDNEDEDEQGEAQSGEREQEAEAEDPAWSAGDTGDTGGSAQPAPAFAPAPAPAPAPASAARARGRPLVDIVGTGGDGKDAFNVSTAAGFVMAACGLRVAKHGNRSSSGSVGAADFLEALGAHIQLDPEQTATVLQQSGFGFVFAQQFHPCMRHVAAARKQLGMRTVFNLLGPLTNPAQPVRQVIGVGDARLGPIFAQLLKARGVRHALVVHSTDGLDEISPVAPTLVWEVRAGLNIEHRTITPEADFGLQSIADLSLVCGGSLAERASSFRELLMGQPGPLRTFVLINAAAGLYVGGLVDSLKQGVDRAAAALDRGEASAVLVHYVGLTKAMVSNAAADSPGQDNTHGTAAGDEEDVQDQQQQQQRQEQEQEDEGLATGTSTGVNGVSVSEAAGLAQVKRFSSASLASSGDRQSSHNALPVTRFQDDVDGEPHSASDAPLSAPQSPGLVPPRMPFSPVPPGSPSAQQARRRIGSGTVSRLSQELLAHSSASPLMERLSYRTQGGIRVTRTASVVADLQAELQSMATWLDTHLGAIMLSDYEQTGRYTKWARAFTDPPLMVVGRHREFSITALNSRGAVLLPALTIALHTNEAVGQVEQSGDVIRGTVAEVKGCFSEEDRSRQPSLFSIVRILVDVFRAPEDHELGLHGAFGYDLAFQFEPTKLRLERPEHQRDLVLFVPDSILVWDSQGGTQGSAIRFDYEFHVRNGVGAEWVELGER